MASEQSGGWDEVLMSLQAPADWGKYVAGLPLLVDILIANASIQNSSAGTPSNGTLPPFHPGLDARYSFSHWTLAALYLVPMALCIIWRLRPIVQSRIYTFWQVAFVTLMLTGCTSRFVFWVFQPLFYSYIIVIRQDLNLYWNIAPGFFSFSCYFIILCLWMEIYHSDTETRRDFRLFYATTMLLMTAVVVTVMASDMLLNEDFYSLQRVPMPTNKLQVSLFLYDAFIFLVASLGFLVYGGLFYMKFRMGNRQPLLQKMRFDILPRVKWLTLLCAVIFTTRAFVIIWVNLKLLDAVDYWWLDLSYYGLLEVLPLIIMLLVFRPARPREHINTLNGLLYERKN